MNVAILLCSHFVFRALFQHFVFFVDHICYFLFIQTFLCALFLHEPLSLPLPLGSSLFHFLFLIFRICLHSLPS